MKKRIGVIFGGRSGEHEISIRSAKTVVEQIDVSVGEVTDPQKPVLTVVQNDPLWVEFHLTTSQSRKLKVAFGTDPGQGRLRGRVVGFEVP